MRYLFILLSILLLGECAAGSAVSASAGYALRAGSADELGQKARKEIIEEAVGKANTYTDSKLTNHR